jgi:hypothetical protein
MAEPLKISTFMPDEIDDEEVAKHVRRLLEEINKSDNPMDQLGYTIDEFKTLAGVRPMKPFKLTDRSWFSQSVEEAYEGAMDAMDNALKLKVQSKEEARKMRERAREQARQAREQARKMREQARAQVREARERVRTMPVVNTQYTGIHAIAMMDDETVPNPDESYRAPGKVDVSALLTEAGLAHKKIIRVAPKDGAITQGQEALVEKLNSTQDKYLFVLDGDPADLPQAEVRKPGFWARFFDWFRRKKVKANDP